MHPSRDVGPARARTVCAAASVTVIAARSQADGVAPAVVDMIHQFSTVFSAPRSGAGGLNFA